jgi:hypothetical protein
MLCDALFLKPEQVNLKDTPVSFLLQENVFYLAAALINERPA